ncbi:MAG: 4-carboxy-4-hydroxy-2-oxoadipate aldolase/oxaloacetate decarboxylase [Planctomycetota bacterium]|jgi:4-hydroxy-4-methyl-2-oxoglutarate aldolase|nr:4-carboxy-4-hydroxy-2-oxoadipate aldolase/oxaloacetate decarboxylase [Planctomycetota bacterium]
MANYIRAIVRPAAGIAADLRRHGSATVHEAIGRLGAMRREIKPIARGMKVCGPAFTVRCPAGDNLTLLKAIREAEKGDVLVVDFGRLPEAGPFGELAALECHLKGLGGLVTTGSVRDSAEIIALGFPVFSAAISIVGTAKESLGQINHPVATGEVIVRPGDLVLGDDDGVVVVPRELAEEAGRKAAARQAKEAAVMERLRAGESLFDIYGYQKTLDRRGWTEE